MGLKRLLTVVLLSLALVVPSFAKGGHGHSGPKTHSSRAHLSSKKSHVRGSNDGTYEGGRGSSHKGGHYKNKHTGDHYRDRQGGSPK